MAIKRLYDTLVGATVAVNQLVKNGNFASTSNWSTYSATLSVSNNTATLTATQSSNPNMNQKISIPSGHKSVLMYEARGSASGNISYYINDGGMRTNKSVSANVWTDVCVIRSATQNATTLYLYTAEVEGYVLDVRNVQLTDLTAYFGSTIADYLYNLETATAGAGIAKLKEWGFFTGEYIPYNAGTLESVEATAHKMVGFNQWDEEWENGRINLTTGADAGGNGIRSKNMIKVLPSTAYHAVRGNYDGATAIVLCYYDAGGNFISYENKIGSDVNFTTLANAFYIRFNVQTSSNVTTYNHDICINLSSDRNGEYEPYVSHTYDLGTDTLRGLFKLDAENNLYADGDTKTSDGTVTRKYGIRAYQSGDESLTDAITDGTNTVYKLTTPTTESADPFTSPQVCYPDGTEEYVTSNGVPVGHETRYQL